MTWMTPFEAEMSVATIPASSELAARQAIAVEHPVAAGPRRPNCSSDGRS